MGDNNASKMFSISPHNCSYCLIHSIPIDMKVLLESKSQIFISFSLIVHAGRNEISSEIKFWIIAFIWAIIYSVYYIWARGPCPQGMRKEPDLFLSQFRYAKLNETISSTPFMLLMMHLFMLLTTLSEISLYITICFKWSKTFEYICTLLRKWN